jgi:hypothetical protein
MTRDQINQLREEESDLLAKFQRKAETIREAKPFLSAAQAFEEALAALPKAYGRYLAAKQWRAYTNDR